MGLKAGLYTDIGRNACSQAYDLHSPNLPEGTIAEREVGLYGHVDQDIRRYFKDWGFDYIKVDACGIADYAAGRAHVKTPGYRVFDPLIVRDTPARERVSEVRALYSELSDALHRHNPDNHYVLSICTWGQVDVRAWGKSVGNSWRTSGDIYPRWSRMLHSFDSAATRALYAHPGAWNDPDMLFIGAGDFDESHLTEARTHFTLWAMINAPLLIGYDLRNAPKSLLDIWGNASLVAINQDRAGNQAVLAYRSDDVDILVKSLSDGTRAVALLNRGLQPYDIVLTAEHLKFDRASPVKLKDLWSDQGSSTFSGEATFKVAPRETRAFIATGIRVLPNGVYLSEMPGGINVAEDGVRYPEPDPELHRPSGWGRHARQRRVAGVHRLGRSPGGCEPVQHGVVCRPRELPHGHRHSLELAHGGARGDLPTLHCPRRHRQRLAKPHHQSPIPRLRRRKTLVRKCAAGFRRRGRAFVGRHQRRSNSRAGGENS